MLISESPVSDLAISDLNPPAGTHTWATTMGLTVANTATVLGLAVASIATNLGLIP